MNSQKAYNLIGLCQKAGKLVSGEFSSEKSIKSNTSYLVILAQDASNNTKKKFENRCTHYNVPYVKFGTREILGKAIGKEKRAVISINDSNFANSISELIAKGK